MNTSAGFFERNLVLIFFVYGLAFFSMGLAVWLESGRTSGFRTARSLRFLAGFGILHGIHEWIEIFSRLDNMAVITLSAPLFVKTLDVILLVLSFLLLIAFGLQMISASQEGNGRNRTVQIIAVFTVVYAGSAAIALLQYKPCPADCMTVADVLSRYLLGIPGAMLAAWALLLQRRAFQKRGMMRCAQDIRWAALALFVYGVVGQFFTKPSVLFPSTIINSDLFQQLFGFPVQFLRAGAASAVAVFVIRALRAFEMERQQHLVATNEARLVAQQETLAIQSRAQAETNKLNRELKSAVQDLTMLFNLSRSLAATLDLDALLQKTMAQVFESVPRIEGGMVFLRGRGERPLQKMVSVGYNSHNGETAENAMERQAEAIGKRVAAAGKPAGWSGDGIILLDDLVHHSKQTVAETGAFTIGLPLTVQERVSGSLVLSLSPQAASFTWRDLSLITTVASQLSLAIENAILYQEVQAREERRGELLHQVVSAQEMERQRIARELHDGAGQMLTALGLGLAAASESVTHDPERGARQLAELKTMSGQVIHELQDLVTGLRPSVLDDLGLVPALRGLVKDFEARTAVSAQLVVQGRQRRIVPEIETELFRITQETLTNVTKHAQADTVRVTITFRPQSIQLAVWDDGRGFHPDETLHPGANRRWGLLGIDERVTLVGGTCKITSQPGSGTMVQVKIPVENDE